MLWIGANAAKGESTESKKNIMQEMVDLITAPRKALYEQMTDHPIPTSRFEQENQELRRIINELRDRIKECYVEEEEKGNQFWMMVIKIWTLVYTKVMIYWNWLCKISVWMSWTLGIVGINI